MHRSVFFVLVFSVVLGTGIVFSSHHWFTVWVGLELNTLSIVPILCGSFSPRNVESSVKYFLIQSVSAAVILNVVVIQAWLYSSWSISQPLGGYTSLLMTFAIGLKLGLFPCHYWFPDVIQGVGFLQGLALSTWQKLAPFVVLANVVDSLEVSVLACLGMLSVLVGGWGGLNQTQVRKVLAFSSIAHMGWICSTVGYSLSGGCVMLLVYVIINSGVFLLAGEYDLKSLSHVGRLSYFNYGGAVCLALGVLSLGGLPPLFGFSIKFVSLSCLVASGSFLLAGVLVLGSLLSLFFYLRVAFNSMLVLFPQHSMVIFGWRSLSSNPKGVTTLRGFTLSLSVGLSLFGLCCFPVLFSFL
uniref:NADH-ubiquinone oxidoreductase chain 2 n=1 Tax=Pentaceraster mammillatus TaxID=2731074 RepID=A0A7S8CUG6_9ECHI|nr:NADH dehydrogenase subunit 2 [Pentaceraster mammillatus]QPC56355.1 NADH dehydrogenase subunit 2 [Pentaceraster mammillatus]WRK21206.1 NADH dehydrogenase subunit 2 [Pentaceraster mammillatus]